MMPLSGMQPVASAAQHDPALEMLKCRWGEDAGMDVVLHLRTEREKGWGVSSLRLTSWGTKGLGRILVSCGLCKQTAGRAVSQA